MKPNFALTFASDSIGLLHRTARGWLEIGTTSVDAPDMGEALSYLRRSALGLAPHGVATKLIIPEEQILYMDVEAPGPSIAKREAQIRRALEGRTPYMVEELVFDWSGDGHMVQVAVVARETLQEAEGFAAEYRLNPVCFAAQPDPAHFAGEPWFGPSSLAASLLPEGEEVERDHEVIQIVSRDAHRAARIEAAAREAASRPAAEDAAPAAPAPRAERGAERARRRAERTAPAAEAASADLSPTETMVEADPIEVAPAEEAPTGVAPIEVSLPEAPLLADAVLPEAVAEDEVWAEVPAQPDTALLSDTWSEAEAVEDAAAPVAEMPEATFEALPVFAHDPLTDPLTDAARALDPAEAMAVVPVDPAAFETAAEEVWQALSQDDEAAPLAAEAAQDDAWPEGQDNGAYTAPDAAPAQSDAVLADPPLIASAELEAEGHAPEDLGPEAPVWLAADETPEPPRQGAPVSQSTFDFAPPPPTGETPEAAEPDALLPEHVQDARFAPGQMSEPRIALPDGPSYGDFAPQPLGVPAHDPAGEDEVERPPLFASAKRNRPAPVQAPVAAPPFADLSLPTAGPLAGPRAGSQITARMDPGPAAPEGFAEDTPEAAMPEASAGRLAVTTITPHRRAPAAPLTPPATAASAAESRPYDPVQTEDIPADLAPAAPDDDLPPPVAPQIRDALAASRGAASGVNAGAAPPRAQPSASGKAAKTGKTGFGALVTAPGIPGLGGRNRVAKAAKPAAAPTSAAKPTPQAAAQTLVAPPPDTLARGAAPPIRGLNTMRRGKPRFLGLILTGLLLLLLAVIGAWSSITLSRNSLPSPVSEQPQDVASVDTGTDGTAVAPQHPAPVETGANLASADTGGTVPSIDDEALADGEDGAAETAATQTAADTALAAAAETAAQGLAPETGNLLLTEAAPTTAAQGQQDEIILSTMDAPPPANDAFALALPQATGDALPAPSAPPPPFGTQYEFDANGLIKPTPQGIVTPEGYLLVAGRPAKVPPARPASIAALAAAANAAGPEAVTAPAAASAVGADPALQGFRPRPRPEGLTGPATEDDAALAIPPAQRMTSVHPRARPASITRIAAQHRKDEDARKAAEAASLSATAAAEATAAATVPQGEDPTAEALAAAAAVSTAPQAGPISPLAVAISRKPPKKPRNFDARIQAAVAAAAAPAPSKPQAEEQPAQPAARSAARKVEPGEDEEPDVAQTRAPKIPTTASVAKNATFANAINLRQTNLIGVYGTPSRRYALVRLGSGQYKKIKVGDRVDGGTVAAITENEVRYKKGGRMVALAMPRG